MYAYYLYAQKFVSVLKLIQSIFATIDFTWRYLILLRIINIIQIINNLMYTCRTIAKQSYVLLRSTRY